MGITKPITQPVVEGVVEGPQGKEYPVLNGVDQYFTIPLWDPGADDHAITYGTDNDDGFIVPASGAVSEIGRVGASYHSGNIRWVSLRNINNPDQSRFYLGDERGRLKEVKRGDGPELLVNGDLSTDSDWDKGAGWSITGGSAVNDGSQTANSYLSQDCGIAAGKTYKVKLKVLERTGSGQTLVFVGAGESAHLSASVSGDVEFIHKPTSPSDSRFYVGVGVGDTASFAAVSVRETNDGLPVNLDATDWQPE